MSASRRQPLRAPVKGACEACHARKVRCVVPPQGGSCFSCQSVGCKCYFLARMRTGRRPRTALPGGAPCLAATAPAASSAAGSSKNHGLGASSPAPSSGSLGVGGLGGRSATTSLASISAPSGGLYDDDRRTPDFAAVPRSSSAGCKRAEPDRAGSLQPAGPAMPPLPPVPLSSPLDNLPMSGKFPQDPLFALEQPPTGPHYSNADSSYLQRYGVFDIPILPWLNSAQSDFRLAEESPQTADVLGNRVSPGEHMCQGDDVSSQQMDFSSACAMQPTISSTAGSDQSMSQRPCLKTALSLASEIQMHSARLAGCVSGHTRYHTHADICISTNNALKTLLTAIDTACLHISAMFGSNGQAETRDVDDSTTSTNDASALICIATVIEILQIMNLLTRDDVTSPSQAGEYFLLLKRCGLHLAQAKFALRHIVQAVPSTTNIVDKAFSVADKVDSSLARLTESYTR